MQVLIKKKNLSNQIIMEYFNDLSIISTKYLKYSKNIFDGTLPITMFYHSGIKFLFMLLEITYTFW